MKIILKATAALIAVLTLSSCCNSECKHSDKINVIFETDIGNDIDDALALDMLYKYHEEGRINFMAVMLNKCAPAPAEYMDIMNTWYGYPDMPVGIVRNGADDDWGKYAQKVVDLKNEDGTPMFKRSKGNYENYPDAHILYRKLLADLPDQSVIIPTVGFSTNLARLLDTPADQYSPLTGKELVARKVKLLVAMAGHAKDSTYAEYNVIKDIPAAKKTLEEWPTPIVISPFEVGRVIKYPGASIQNDFTWVTDKHPMVESYKAFDTMPYDRSTWDLTAVLYAVEGDAMFTMSEKCDIKVTSRGTTHFTPNENGNVIYMMVDDTQAAAINKRFQEIITKQPKNYKK
jgi:inosine-uridine nucleoside N-ribohydrolase